ncbi:hypothetical protein V2A60_003326 [Cordyceps javanica]
MTVDGDNDLLARVAAGETLELENRDAWPALQIDILARLDKIAHTEFSIPDLPPPRELRRSLDNGDASSSSPMADPSSQEADKENAPVPADDGDGKDSGKKAGEVEEQSAEAAVTGDDADTVMEKADEASAETPDGEASTHTNAQTEPAAGNTASESITADDGSGSSGEPKLPIQLAAMLGDIKSHIQTFTQAPPHTLQRLAELVLHPRAHYRALATYLHAVDRVVQVTSGLNTYPLPPAIPDMSSMHINGVDGSKDPATSVSWGNPTMGVYGVANSSNHTPPAPVGSDEALGGALLTPIPWLTRRSPESGDAASTSSGGGSTAGGSSNGAQIHSEGTETIDGPNGMGSIETVSVSVNGVPSTGHARGVTQGELLRQEQRAGVVPVSQLSRNGAHPQHALQHHQLQSQREAGAHGDGSDEDEDDEHQAMEEDRRASALEGGEDDDEAEEAEEEEEVPHARGPEEIGVGDTGPQTATTSSMGEGGLEMEGIDVAAAVGRPREEEEHPSQNRPPPEDEETADRDSKEAAAATTTEADEEPQSPEGAGTKREAEDAAESEPSKKMKEE